MTLTSTAVALPLSATLDERRALLPGVVDLLATYASEWDRAGRFPTEGLEAVHRAGLLHLTVGEQYGGPGVPLPELVRVLTDLGRGDPSTALITLMTLFVHAQQAVLASWPDDVYAELLDVGGPVLPLANHLRVEPALGTPARGGLPETIGRRTASGWSVSGHKIYSTGSTGLAWMAVWGRTDEATPRVGSFLVRGGSPGVRVENTWDHLGLRASASNDVELDDVEIPFDRFIASEPDRPGRSGPGSDALVQTLAGVGLSVVALYVGVAEAARDWLVDFLRHRVPSALGAPLATLPRFHAALGEIDVRLGTARDVLEFTARGVVEGDPRALDRAVTGAAKVAAVRELVIAIEYALSLIGNPALTTHNPLQRHYRDLLTARVHTPQADAVVEPLGRRTLTA